MTQAELLQAFHSEVGALLGGTSRVSVNASCSMWIHNYAGERTEWTLAVAWAGPRAAVARGDTPEEALIAGRLEIFPELCAAFGIVNNEVFDPCLMGM